MDFCAKATFLRKPMVIEGKQLLGDVLLLIVQCPGTYSFYHTATRIFFIFSFGFSLNGSAKGESILLLVKLFDFFHVDFWTGGHDPDGEGQHPSAGGLLARWCRNSVSELPWPGEDQRRVLEFIGGNPFTRNYLRIYNMGGKHTFSISLHLYSQDMCALQRYLKKCQPLCALGKRAICLLGLGWGSYKETPPWQRWGRWFFSSIWSKRTSRIVPCLWHGKRDVFGEQPKFKDTVLVPERPMNVPWRVSQRPGLK